MITNKCEHFVGCLTRDGRHRVMAAYSADGVKVYAVLAYVDGEMKCVPTIYNNGDKCYFDDDSEYDIMLQTSVVEDGEYPRVDDDSVDDTWVVLMPTQDDNEYMCLHSPYIMQEQRARWLANTYSCRAVRITLHD